MLIRVRFAGVLGVFAGFRELFVTAASGDENILDFGRFSRHLVEFEFEFRRQPQTGLVPHQCAQAAFRLIQRLLGTFAFTLLFSVMTELGPVDGGDLQIIGDPYISNGHAVEPLVVKLAFQRRSDHTLDERRDARRPWIRPCQWCSFPGLAPALIADGALYAC